MRQARVKKIDSLSVGKFFEKNATELHLNLCTKAMGFDRLIREPNLNRPGLALAGFFDYFPLGRLQVLGTAEMAYLESLPREIRHERLEWLFSQDIPCLILARNYQLSEELGEFAERYQVPVFSSSLMTMKFLSSCTLRLDHHFASSVSLHGCMLDIRGIGVLILGESGAGKSETAIGLLERGASLVADDLVQLREVNGELIGTAPELSKGYIEIRGIGIINVANLYGLASIRPDKRLDLVVSLKPSVDLNQVDRTGMAAKCYEILGREIPHVEVPVGPGRDTARMVAIAALDQQLRRLGYNMADEFNQKLMAQMALQSGMHGGLDGRGLR